MSIRTDEDKKKSIDTHKHVNFISSAPVAKPLAIVPPSSTHFGLVEVEVGIWEERRGGGVSEWGTAAEKGFLMTLTREPNVFMTRYHGCCQSGVDRSGGRGPVLCLDRLFDPVLADCSMAVWPIEASSLAPNSVHNSPALPVTIT